jgi:hypothetical protein
MKNRKREICTSGSVRDEDGQPPHLLGQPTDNRGRAFCCVGCRAGYFKNRCAVCEAKLLIGPSNREVCRRSECRAELRKFPERYRATVCSPTLSLKLGGGGNENRGS